MSARDDISRERIEELLLDGAPPRKRLALLAAFVAAELHNLPVSERAGALYEFDDDVERELRAVSLTKRLWGEALLAAEVGLTPTPKSEATETVARGKGTHSASQSVSIIDRVHAAREEVLRERGLK